MWQESRIDEMKGKLAAMGAYPLDIGIVGGTGVGKSTTVNAIFGSIVAQVGTGWEPETMEVNAYQSQKYLRVWDTPGLGDSVERDRCHAQKIQETLYKTYMMNGRQYGLLDMVMVVLDGSGRDLGTTYYILENVILPNFPAERILVVMNQADMAMKGHHWDEEKSMPDSVLQKFLDEKAKSVQRRIKETTNIDIQIPVYYSAEKGHHIDEVMDCFIHHIPQKRREFRSV